MYYRVLLEDVDGAEGFEVLKPTIEDGYMAVIKGF